MDREFRTQQGKSHQKRPHDPLVTFSAIPYASKFMLPLAIALSEWRKLLFEIGVVNCHSITGCCRNPFSLSLKRSQNTFCEFAKICLQKRSFALLKDKYNDRSKEFPFGQQPDYARPHSGQSRHYFCIVSNVEIRLTSLAVAGFLLPSA